MASKLLLLVCVGIGIITYVTGASVKRQAYAMEYHPMCNDDADCALGTMCYYMTTFDPYGYCEAALLPGTENYPCEDDYNCNLGLTCVYSDAFQAHGHCLDYGPTFII